MMRKSLRLASVAMGVLLAAILAVSFVQAQGRDLTVNESGLDSPVLAELVVDGRAIGAFTRISGLESEVEIIDWVCPIVDDDCDSAATEAWEKEVRRVLWTIMANADALEREVSLSGRARHDMAMNAIRNMKAIAAEVETTLNAGDATHRTKHDTVKNSIGHIRAALAVYSEITVNEEGVNRAPEREIGAALASLQRLGEDAVVRKRPGRVKYANITLERGLTSDPSLYQWYQQTAGRAGNRSSISVIMKDRSGQEVARFNLFEAWPVRYSAGMVEEIELAVERVERAG